MLETAAQPVTDLHYHSTGGDNHSQSAIMADEEKAKAEKLAAAKKRVNIPRNVLPR
jgi:hypothetical protein